MIAKGCRFYAYKHNLHYQREQEQKDKLNASRMLTRKQRHGQIANYANEADDPVEHIATALRPQVQRYVTKAFLEFH